MFKKRLALVMRTSLVPMACLFLVRVSAAQSTEMDRPTRLSQSESSAVVDTPVTHYYAFEAGPGEVTVFVAVSHLLVTWELLDPNMNSMSRDSVYNSNIDEDQKITRIMLTRRATVVLKVKSGVYPVAGGGKYRFRLGGSVDVGKEPWITGIPHVGVLTVKMKDGSLKEIVLKDVVSINVR